MKTIAAFLLSLTAAALLQACEPARDSRGDTTDSSAMKAPTPPDGTSMPVAPAPKLPADDSAKSD